MTLAEACQSGSGARVPPEQPWASLHCSFFFQEEENRLRRSYGKWKQAGEDWK